MSILTEEQAIQQYAAQIPLMREAAKQLASLTSVLPTIYFALLSFSDLRKVVHGFEALPFLLPAIPWLASLVLIMEIFLPKSLSPNELQALVERYQRRLYLAYWCMVVGLILLLIQVAYYLAYVPVPTAAP